MAVHYTLQYHSTTAIHDGPFTPVSTFAILPKSCIVARGQSYHQGGIPTPDDNAATKKCCNIRVSRAVGLHTVRVLLGDLIHPRKHAATVKPARKTVQCYA